MKASIAGAVVLIVTFSTAHSFGWRESAMFSFDAATVRSARAGEGTDIDQSGGVLTMRNVNLKKYLTLAYGVKDEQIIGPKWLESLRYDIVAKADSDAAQDRHLLRLQTLLREWFKVAYHIERKEMPI